MVSLAKEIGNHMDEMISNKTALSLKISKLDKPLSTAQQQVLIAISTIPGKWVSALELHTQFGVCPSDKATGIVLANLVRLGLLEIDRAKNSHEGATKYRLTI